MRWFLAMVVMRGRDPRIHLLRKSLLKKMDCRVKPGNDEHGDLRRVPRMLRSAPRLSRRGALLIRGPACLTNRGPGSAEQREERCTAARDTMQSDAL
jgi:hypothetical protein